MKKLISSLAVVSSAAILGTLSMTAFAAGNGNAIIYDDGSYHFTHFFTVVDDSSVLSVSFESY